VPIAGRAPYGDVNEYLPKFKQMVAEAGRSPDALLLPFAWASRPTGLGGEPPSRG
jgi:hypothetical protein